MKTEVGTTAVVVPISFRGIASPKIRGAVGYQNNVILQGMARKVPIFLAGHVEVSDVARFVAVVRRNGNRRWPLPSFEVIGDDLHLIALE